ncbi:MAG: L,D-transpeptidase family protein [Longimicrobiales bacterium]
MSERMMVGRAGLAALTLALAASAACDNEPLGEPSPRIQEVLQDADSTAELALPNGDTILLSPPIVAFYRERGYRQAWTDYDEILERGWALLETMDDSELDGLDPQRYRYPLAYRMVQQVEGDSIDESREPAQMAEVDMVLSEVFARYADHLAGGTIDPNASGLNWQIPRDRAPVGELLRQIVAGEDPAELVAGLRPQAPEYERLMHARAKYDSIAARGGWSEVPEDTPDEIGESGAGVSALRQRLIAERDPAEARLASAGVAQPERFDEELKQGLEHFQARHGLDPDGALGELTLEALNTSVADRLLQIKLNMDQWRWLPYDLGDRYILVNVAGFELEVVDQDSVVMTMNVVVGQEGWETPIFRDTMETIVVNPYWNVPASIEREEVLPRVRSDPGYLARNDMEVLRGNNVVNPYSISWGAVSPGSVRFRQRPGPQNALGQVKFLFPNRNNVYLHDTPADQYFSRTSRAFSHGCIRIEKPLELARYLFRTVTDRSVEDLETLLARDSEQWVRVTEPVPVYILYFTAWAGRDGTVRFYPDVYERNRVLDEQARRKLQVAAR